MIDSSNKDDETIANKLKTRINILSEFLFNNGKINGFTLEQVSDDVKLKLNKIMLNIDDKVEERFPKYKNNIKDGYEEIKANATIKYLEVLDKVCNQDREYLCNEAKRDFNKMKDSFKLTFSLIKDLAIKGKNNLLEYFNN